MIQTTKEIFITRKNTLECLIREGNLDELKKFVANLDTIQEHLLDFDDPSLVMLAIEVYFDPTKLDNLEYQLDVVEFLIKCGLSLFVPFGSIAIYIMDLGIKWGITEETILELLNMLIDYGKFEVVEENINTPYYQSFYNGCCQYLRKNWAALKIQTLWKSTKTNHKSAHCTSTYTHIREV